MCAPLIKSTFAGESKDSVHYKNLEASLTRLEADVAGDGDLKLPSAATFFEEYSTKEGIKQAKSLQQRYRTLVWKRRDAALRVAAEQGGKMAKARLHAQRQRGASYLITTVPTCGEQELSDEDVEINTRLALGLPPHPQMPNHCHCGEPNGSYEADPWHGLSCSKELHSSVTDRHDLVKHAVARLADAVGASVVEEPKKKQRQDRADNKKRPDVLVKLPGKRWWTDNTIWHPYGPTNLRVSAQNPQALLKSAENEKHIKYDEEASQAGATFVPIALESTGGFGSEALLFIKELIAESKRQHMVWRDKEYVNMVYRNIAMAVARGNTGIIRSNLAETERERGRRRRG
jgi:hypothetical protein